MLSGPAAAERAGWKYYRMPDDGELAAAGLAPGTDAVTVDVERFLGDRRDAVQFAGIILAGTAARPAQFGCFGLHEWAMVYRQDKFELRHEYLQLRLGSERTDRVVEENRIRCSHFDAFRFYTPDAVPLNSLAPSRENQRTMEQPGCLHANMDLYKWAYKLAPALPSELVMDCFELSWRIRAMDMQASPYDLERVGLPAHPDRDARTARPSTSSTSGLSPPNRRNCGAACCRNSRRCWRPPASGRGPCTRRVHGRTRHDRPHRTGQPATTSTSPSG